MIHVLQFLLQKDPEKRYQSAREALDALQEALGQKEQTESVEIRESFLQAAKFVGRAPEMKQLDKALKSAGDGAGSVWLVGGESGVGKSRFIEEFRIRALVKGWQVIRGHAEEDGGKEYQLWQDIVPYLALSSDLSDLEASILQETFPQIGQLLPHPIPSPAELSGSAAQQRLVITLSSILQRQERPTLLLLEDLHWAHESLAPINQVLKVLAQMPHLMIVATYRHDERPQLPEELVGAQTLILERLNNTQIQALAQAMLGKNEVTPEIIALLSQETEGNTFFMVEVMRAFIEEAGQITTVKEATLPTDVFTTGMAELLQRRINQVTPQDRPLLQFAAVYGRRLDLQLLAQLVPETDISDFLQRVSNVAILVVQNGQWLV